ncbi:uncharacterized protein HaLaN_13778 [Haematococcus lacustris]|uniref:Uncharacterized protein n=1 Tax=Haematococcus lacustris TaxID=44745 RepID=A0A699ZD35_HAELA|nr:uncharacterized protein HaLaN_13778 [Haematococcus lacustris]
MAYAWHTHGHGRLPPTLLPDPGGLRSQQKGGTHYCAAAGCVLGGLSRTRLYPSSGVWQAFSFIQLNYFMTARGYLFFLVCLYTMSGCLVTNLALCIWVSKSFQANKFDHVWQCNAEKAQSATTF